MFNGCNRIRFNGSALYSGSLWRRLVGASFEYKKYVFILRRNSNREIFYCRNSSHKRLFLFLSLFFSFSLLSLLRFFDSKLICLPITHRPEIIYFRAAKKEKSTWRSREKEKQRKRVQSKCNSFSVNLFLRFRLYACCRCCRYEIV